MNISKVYYEELKSKCVGGKWESVRIGAEVEVGNYGSETACLSVAKDFVKEKLNKELGYDTEKKQKELLKALEVIDRMVSKII